MKQRMSVVKEHCRTKLLRNNVYPSDMELENCKYFPQRHQILNWRHNPIRRYLKHCWITVVVKVEQSYNKEAEARGGSTTCVWILLYLISTIDWDRLDFPRFVVKQGWSWDNLREQKRNQCNSFNNVPRSERFYARTSSTRNKCFCSERSG